MVVETTLVVTQFKLCDCNGGPTISDQQLVFSRCLQNPQRRYKLLLCWYQHNLITINFHYYQVAFTYCVNLFSDGINKQILILQLPVRRSQHRRHSRHVTCHNTLVQPPVDKSHHGSYGRHSAQVTTNE